MINACKKKLVNDILSHAGISIGGCDPWDIQIHDSRFYNRVVRHPELALGESYMDGWWECGQLDEFIDRLVRYNMKNTLIKNPMFLLARLSTQLHYLFARIINFQSKKRAYIVGERHYDIGNDIYRVMLDKRMNYSCGYWNNATTLDEAQEAKLNLICRKLQLEPGMRVLDIGCGWAGFSKYAAEKFGATVVGITVSKEQQKLATELCKDLPVTICLQDYRDLNEKFDRICSVGMFEHVGYKNYPEYFAVANRCLTPDGLFLLHTIGNNYSTTISTPWINKYIFPNGMIPSIAQLAKPAEKILVMEDWHNFGADYDKTLMAWYNNFNNHWDNLKNKYDEKFRRMWNFYLLSCAGAFRARDMQLWQIVFSKNGLVGGYTSVR